MAALFNLRHQFAKYGEYHDNPVNVIIHCIFVPAILWSTLSLLTIITPTSLFTFPPTIASILAAIPGPTPLANISTLGMVAYQAFYFMLDPMVGALIMPFVYTIMVYAEHFATTSECALSTTVGVFLVSWAIQFIGHGVFEKRAPALLDNLVQAFLMAPFFVFLELLFMLGFRPQLRAELKAEIDQRIAKFKASRGPSSSG